MKGETRRAWTELAEFVQRGKATEQIARRSIPMLRPPKSLADMGLLGGKPRGKYGNRATLVDGYRFHSKLEADRYVELKQLRAAGHVHWFLRQVPFDVTPGVTYRADFLVVWNDGRVGVEDTKGHLTDASRIKIKAVEASYGIRVRILTRADVRAS